MKIEKRNEILKYIFEDSDNLSLDKSSYKEMNFFYKNFDIKMLKIKNDEIIEFVEKILKIISIKKLVKIINNRYHHSDKIIIISNHIYGKYNSLFLFNVTNNQHQKSSYASVTKHLIKKLRSNKAMILFILNNYQISNVEINYAFSNIENIDKEIYKCLYDISDLYYYNSMNKNFLKYKNFLLEILENTIKETMASKHRYSYVLEPICLNKQIFSANNFTFLKSFYEMCNNLGVDIYDFIYFLYVNFYLNELREIFDILKIPRKKILLVTSNVDDSFFGKQKNPNLGIFC